MRKRAKEWQEYRRIQVNVLHQKGWKGNHIAEALGVSKNAVNQWPSRESEGCKDASHARQILGPKSNSHKRKLGHYMNN